jgi:signal transduction histidine kinase
VNAHTTPKTPNTFPATAPASLKAKRCALINAIALLVLFCVLIPFARISLPRIEAFIPIYESNFAVICLVAAAFLFFGFRRSRLRGVLVLASGYLFVSFMAVPRLLTFPGIFSNSGLLGAGPQTSAWLAAIRQEGLPLFILSYALLRRRGSMKERSPAGVRGAVLSAAAAVAAGVGLLSLLATAGHALLPPLVDGERYTIGMAAVSAISCLLCLAALAVLGLQRPYSIFNLWLLVVLIAWLLDAVLGTAVSAGRHDIGFYASRLYGLFAASVLPVVLVLAASRIAGRLDEAIAIAEERNAELARSREELAQAQRLEAIGQLTGGVAHDFNNLLTAVTGNLDLILEAQGDSAKIERLAQSALRAAQRGEYLVRQLLTYARIETGRPRTVDLNQLIGNIENLVRRVIGEQIDVVTSLSPTLARVQIDPAQFETAILNLAINSRDAMAAGGRLTIATRNVSVDREHPALDPELTPGSYVMVAVADAGAGMTPAVLARAFDPFFTTKGPGKGSGLGLSQVHGFAKTAGGHVAIRSALGVGTTVELYLPVSADQSIPPAPEVENPSSPPAGGAETILLVEDDEDVLAVTAENLRELGYRVVTASDAMRAVEILRSDQPIDLLLSDVIIPGGTNGAQLAVTARRVRPALKVLLTSGYTADALSLEHGLPDDLTVVSKPYQREELAVRLRAAITG